MRKSDVKVIIVGLVIIAGVVLSYNLGLRKGADISMHNTKYKEYVQEVEDTRVPIEEIQQEIESETEEAESTVSYAEVIENFNIETSKADIKYDPMFTLDYTEMSDSVSFLYSNDMGAYDVVCSIIKQLAIADGTNSYQYELDWDLNAQSDENGSYYTIRYVPDNSVYRVYFYYDAYGANGYLER